MDYQKLNKIIQNLPNIRYEYRSKQLHTTKGDDVGYGEETYNWEEVYDVGLEKGMFLKLKVETDSYGDNEFIRGVEFVRGKEKTVIVYEF